MESSQQRKCNDSPQSKAWWIKLNDGRFGFRIDFNSIVDMDLHLIRFAGGTVELKTLGSISVFLLFLKENADKDIFTKFCSVILEVPIQDGAQQYADSILHVLQQWMRFLRKINDTKELDVRKQIGLIGELTFLHCELNKKRNVPYREIMKAWIGPDKAPNDFILRNTSFEIKCHYYDEDTVHIANEQQLQFNGRPLYLVAYSVAQVDDGKNVEEIISDIKEEIRNEDSSLLTKFDNKLFFAGYNPAITYSGLIRFTIDDPAFYNVDTDFPHLVRNNNSKAITSIKYNLNLTELLDFRKSDFDM